MSRTISPLRYPGGKSSIVKMVTRIIDDNAHIKGFYAEPYAGGAGLALNLLFSKQVNEIYLNDIDRSIWAFWYSILNFTDQFIEKVNATPVNLDEWYKQKEIQHEKEKADILTLGFSTFFLNRTNRSGIILKAGPIGGFSQKGVYKIDCRFNKQNLITRIVEIANYKDQINLFNMDAMDFMDLFQNADEIKSGFFCIDPPYFNQGKSLYTDFYSVSDHTDLASYILKFKCPWILTYDNAETIRQLYRCARQYSFELNYTAANKRKGTELLIISSDINISETLIKSNGSNKQTISNDLELLVF